MFNALKHRNFRLYLSGQFISLIGTWMQQLATSWLVYRLTSSPLWLGISMFSVQIPMFAIGWMAGVVVDRVDKRKFLVWTQALAGLQALVLAILAMNGKINLAELIAMNLILGLVNAIDMPLRQAFVIQMIGRKEDLPNAIALNSSVMNGTRLIGPAIAGLTIATFGEGPCFLLNAVSYIAVITALLLMKLEKHPPHVPGEHFGQSLRIGMHAAFDHPVIRAMLLLLAYTSLTAMSYNTLFPALAVAVTSAGANAPGGAGTGAHSGAGALGAITAASGLGALIGAMYLARRGNVAGLGRVAGRAVLVFGASLLIIAVVAWAQLFPALLACVFVSGMSLMILLASGNTIIQTYVEDDKRGRVMAIFSFALLGTAPFGSLLMGWLAQKLGLPAALALNGAFCLAGGAAYRARAHRLNAFAPPGRETEAADPRGLVF